MCGPGKKGLSSGSDARVTERLYYADSCLARFSSSVTDADPDRTLVRLNRTAFYPASGGQPHDLGTLHGIPVVDVFEQEGEILHRLSEALPPDMVEVEGLIDAERRFDHMQQHTGQHLLSAVLARMYGAETVSFHMGAAVSTIDLAGGQLDSSALAEAELHANRLLVENRPVNVTYEESGSVSGLRKTSERSGTLRIITIEDLDRSACGGTHVRATGEIGSILLGNQERVRGNLRLEFVCGLRAVGRARANFQALSGAARVLSAAVEDLPALVAAQAERLAESEKATRKLTLELAAVRGRDLYANTPLSASGFRLHTKQVSSLDDELRAEAQAFVAGSRGVFLAWSPAAVLFAAAADSALHAGNLLKPALTAAGGRGGGTQSLAQGSVPEPAAMASLLDRLTAGLR